jgi:tRNA(fMet)-specific endonuclease VapC
MNGRYLLDTNIVIALFAEDTNVISQLVKGREIFIPSIVIGELYYGAEKSSKADENINRINEFASHNVILNCSKETAKYYGEIKNDLQKKGRPMPENDIWISAIAIQYELTLVSRDRHFKEVTDLKTEKW